MEGEGEGSLFGGQWKEKEKVLCSVVNGRRRRRFFSTYSHFPPKQFYLNLHFLSFDIKVSFYYGPRPLFIHSLPSLTYKLRSHNLMSQVPSTFIVNLILLKIFFLFLESMASCTVTSYGPQVAQVNEEPPSESSLDLTLT